MFVHFLFHNIYTTRLLAYIVCHIPFQFLMAYQYDQICPEAEPWYDELIEATESGMGTPMQGIKALSKSIKEISRIDEMSDITKSTSELLTGETFKKAAMKKRLKALGGKTDHKSVSQSTLIHGSDNDSFVYDEDVKRFRHSISMAASEVSRIQF